VLEQIGELIINFLYMNKEERPIMREIADTLERARRFEKQVETQEKSLEEIESLFGDSIDIDTGDDSLSSSFAQQDILAIIEVGRR
jgi:hypothetical protein